jgi:hypothetical protein
MNQLLDQGAQIDHAAGTAQQMVSDSKVGAKLLRELKWRIFKEKLCMFTLILVSFIFTAHAFLSLFLLFYGWLIANPRLHCPMSKSQFFLVGCFLDRR